MSRSGRVALEAAAEDDGAAAHRPRSVVPESLDPGTRGLLGDTFGAPVFDVYGSVELGVIAWARASPPEDDLIRHLGDQIRAAVGAPRFRAVENRRPRSAS